MSNNLLDVIDSKTRGQENLSEQIVLKRKSLVRDIIINDLKSFILQLEAEKKTDTKEEIRVQRVYRESQQASENKCYRCNGAGLWAKDCRFKNTEECFCYVCQTIK